MTWRAQLSESLLIQTNYSCCIFLESGKIWRVFSQDMTAFSANLQTWRLNISHTKTVTAAFFLNNREIKRELKVYNCDRLLPFCPNPTFLGG